MSKKDWMQFGLAAVITLGSCGCEELPGNRKTQGAVIGGAAGAATGAVIGGSDHRALGAVLGAVLGGAGGYVIGASTDRVKNKDTAAAQDASRTATNTPATPDQVRTANTADVNRDGFVTLDEVVAMKQAGLGDQEMIDRLRATDQVFDLTANQRQYLLDQGVSAKVVDQMPGLNATKKQELLSTGGDRISRPQP